MLVTFSTSCFKLNLGYYCWLCIVDGMSAMAKISHKAQVGMFEYLNTLMDWHLAGHHFGILF